MTDKTTVINAATDSSTNYQAYRDLSIDTTVPLSLRELAILKSLRDIQALVNSSDGSLSVPTASVAGATTMTAGAAAAAIVLRLGADTTEGLEIRVIDEDVACSSAAAAFDLTEDVPSGAVILSVQANLETAITAVTAVKVGVGIAANPDKYGKTSGVTKNLKVDTIPDWAPLSSAEDIQVYAVDTAGAAAGTIGGAAEIVRVRIVYAMTNSLADAA